METTLECSNDPELCQFRRLIVANHPADRNQDLQDGRHMLRGYRVCPSRGQDSLTVRQRDLFRRIVRTA